MMTPSLVKTQRPSHESSASGFWSCSSAKKTCHGIIENRIALKLRRFVAAFGTLTLFSFVSFQMNLEVVDGIDPNSAPLARGSFLFAVGHRNLL
jgi:hypothetical protein